MHTPRNDHPKRPRARTPLVITALLALAAGLAPAPMPANPASAQGDSRTFPETGKTVTGRFLEYWTQNGGLPQQGFPISDVLQERSDTDGKTYTVQYFERAVFEAHPENQRPYDVLLSLLGNFYYQQKYPEGAPNQRPNTEANAIRFPETGKTLGGIFRDYWNAHGGLAQQGFPISDEFQERSDLDGKTYTVQYFERAVFEHHPDNQPPYNVLLSQLGTFRFRAKYPQAQTQPTAGPTAPPTQQVSNPPAPLELRPVTVETTDATRKGALSVDRQVNLPPGFHIRVFAAGLNDVRWLGLSPSGLIYATQPDEGRVVTLPDANHDGVADAVNVFADGMRGVHGIAFKDNAVYVATESQVIRLEDTNADGRADKRDTLVDDLPAGVGHSTRTLAFSQDGTRLFVSVGSSCNACRENEQRRAAISLYSPDGTFQKVYASGLRNAVGMIVHPVTGELWATNNGRDNLGNDVPPETVYKVQEGADYGWPFCYGDRIPDTTMAPPQGFCETTGLPEVKMQAHSAPLGLAFYTGQQFPSEFRGDLFVAFHGSWNRNPPTGYKLVRIKMRDNQVDRSSGDPIVQDFATGWLVGREAWGRPVDPLVAPDGTLLLTDDAADAIYGIYYADSTP
jgi:glucose/arabinose dehydrogenase